GCARRHPAPPAPRLIRAALHERSGISRPDCGALERMLPFRQLTGITRESMANSEEQGPDLWHYWRIIKKRVWVILGTTLAVGLAATVTTVRKPKVYQATTEIIIAPQAPKALGDSVEVVQLGAGTYWSDTEYYSTQLRILTSYSMARETVVR